MRPLALVLTAVLPAVLSLLVLLLTAPEPAARTSTSLAVTPQAVLAYEEAPATPPSTPLPTLASQPRMAIAAQPQAALESPASSVNEAPLDQTVKCSQLAVDDNEWCVEYYRDRDQNDAPILVETRSPTDDVVKIDWPNGSWPKPTGLPPANFRMVMTGTFNFADTRSYLFTLRLQGSARMYLDGQIVIDTYFVGRKQQQTFNLPINRNRHTLRFEFYLDDGPSSIYLAVQPDGNRSNFWLGRYYNNTAMDPPVVMIRQDAHLDFTWQDRPGDENVNPDNFSVQWLRVLQVPRTGWTCRMIADDRVRVYVDGQLVPEWNNWDGVGLLDRTATLHAGRRIVEVHFVEQSGLAQIHFTCEPAVPPR